MRGKTPLAFNPAPLQYAKIFSRLFLAMILPARYCAKHGHQAEFEISLLEN